MARKPENGPRAVFKRASDLSYPALSHPAAIN